MKIQIVATDEVRTLAQKAWDIQDASNPRGVATFLTEVMDNFRSEGSAMMGQNPITILVLCKLCHLAHVDQPVCDEAWEAIINLKEGKNIEWEVR